MSTFNFEQLLVANELGEVIRLHNQAIERLKAFREQHPHLIAPNLARMAEENLKENVSVLYRELNNLHKPKSQQRRHVCRECHNVFVVALPGGICDECRSKLTAPAGRYAYGPRPQMPEAESDTVSDVTPVPDQTAGSDMEEETEEVSEAPVAEGVVQSGPAEGEDVSETEVPLPETAEETKGTQNPAPTEADGSAEEDTEGTEREESSRDGDEGENRGTASRE